MGSRGGASRGSFSGGKSGNSKKGRSVFAHNHTAQIDPNSEAYKDRRDNDNYQQNTQSDK